MLVRDVMNKNVMVVSPDAKVKEAVEILNKYRIGSLIVISQDKMLGILTERDILKLIEEGKNPETTLVSEIMTTEVHTIEPNDDVTNAAELMVEKKVKRLPVTTQEGALVGIITATDIMSSEPKFMEAISALLLVGKKKTMAG